MDAMQNVKLNGTVSSMSRRETYLTTALQLFAAHGFNGVSMDQLVAETGGSKATLYRYFPSKESLFAAIIDEIAAATVVPAGGDDWAGVGLVEGLRSLGGAVAAGALDERTIVLLRLAAGEHSRFPDLGRTLFELGPGRSYARVRAFLELQRDAGVVEIDDPQIAAEQFLGGIVGHQQMRLALGLEPPSPAEVELRVEQAIRAFVATYCPTPAIKQV